MSIKQFYSNLFHYIKIEWIISFVIILIGYYIYNKKQVKEANSKSNLELISVKNSKEDISDSDSSDDNYELDSDFEDFEKDLSNIMRSKSLFDDSSDDDEEWSDHRGRVEAENLGLNFKLKNKIEYDFYENEIIKDKYINLQTYERSIWHHRSWRDNIQNAELKLWEKDKNYLIKSWKLLKQEFFNAKTLKQKYSHLKAFEKIMKYRPLDKLTGKYKTLNEELRKNDNKHLMKMKIEIKRLIDNKLMVIN